MSVRISRAIRLHQPVLDGVRGLAIVLVLVHNLNVLQGHQTPAGHVLDLFDDLGWVGVQLFFVLSGFLITGILIDTKTSTRYFGTFFVRRILRIFPLYYATLFVAFVLVPLGEVLTALLRVAGVDLPGVRALVFGLLLMGIIALSPNGIWPWLARRLRIGSAP